MMRIENSMGFFDRNGTVQVDKVIDFMGISRTELASAFGLTSDQLRPERMGTRTREVIGELAGAIEYVANFFSQDAEKARQWLNLPNAHFGGSTPKTIIINGRFRRVKNFIYSSQKR